MEVFDDTCNGNFTLVGPRLDLMAHLSKNPAIVDDLHLNQRTHWEYGDGEIRATELQENKRHDC